MDPDIDDRRCQIPHCKRRPILTYRERELCAYHWELLCCDDEKLVGKMLTALGLKDSREDEKM